MEKVLGVWVSEWVDGRMGGWRGGQGEEPGGKWKGLVIAIGKNKIENASAGILSYQDKPSRKTSIEISVIQSYHIPFYVSS